MLRWFTFVAQIGPEQARDLAFILVLRQNLIRL